MHRQPLTLGETDKYGLAEDQRLSSQTALDCANTRAYPSLSLELRLAFAFS